jgi:hypothetical protein
MNPNIDKQNMNVDPNTEFLYKPLFEVISLKKKKKKRTGNNWVDRLYYQKPDFSKFKEQISINSGRSSRQHTARGGSPSDSFISGRSKT